ncbi:o-succinylbenzoate synthase [Pannus brasiliensis CCIBt3594]|uniref:o-succinylbenzoate synthase n=1 Tax=Pannus brasiliensis CCIBt3594 TaxID=1427578 RepID=A0AAW9QTG4_9CHRO
MYHFSYRVYQRPFRRPLRTHHGWWECREGIILRLAGESGRVGWGEIAPIAWFGSETLEEAVSFCREIGNSIAEAAILSIPDSLPACQFGFESALEDTRSNGALDESSPNYSYLLPNGQEALDTLPEVLKNTSIDTFKWKIGVSPLETESAIAEKLTRQLPDGAKLRLDANGGLTLSDARVWLTLADELSNLEFIEQPLPPRQFGEMLSLGESFRTPIALDESVCNLQQVESCYREGWRGVFVIKPSIMGSIRRFREVWNRYPVDAVFSSALESSIGRRSALRLAVECSRNDRALGFGVGQWFADGIDRETEWLETLWKTS